MQEQFLLSSSLNAPYAKKKTRRAGLESSLPHLTVLIEPSLAQFRDLTSR
jgi:hypothetical protein